MKRCDCTVEKLKLLGYMAKHVMGSTWNTPAHEIVCTQEQAKETLEIFARAVRRGYKVEIRRNYARYQVEVHIDETDFTDTPGRDEFFIFRLMNEAERLEADLITGRANA